jgi:2,4-dienoyl-CoA reductase-like NADH-dependent reductase (Old Yellow Enzyme family)
MASFNALFQPISIGSMRVKNRLVMAPMVTNYCEHDGAVTDRFKAYFRARAKGGVGFIIAEATYVHPSGKGFPNELGVYKDELIPGLKELVDEIHQYGAKVALQLYIAAVKVIPQSQVER